MSGIGWFDELAYVVGAFILFHVAAFGICWVYYNTRMLADREFRERELEMRVLMGDRPFRQQGIAPDPFIGNPPPPRGANADPIARVNRELADLTTRIGEADKAMATLDAQIQARRESTAPTEDILRSRAKALDIALRIARETDPRRRGQLSREKAQAETALATGEAANANLQALVDRRRALGDAADDLRLQRSRIMASLAGGQAPSTWIR